MYQNKFDKIGESAKLGYDAENDFAYRARVKGYMVFPATKQQNMFDHIDYFFTKEGVSHSVDVKSEKKVSRSDSSTQSELIFMELKNVQGNKGWLYGKAEFIAFGREGKFYIIRRRELVDRVERLSKDGKEVSSSKEALYNFYTRFLREDVITLVKFTDIEDLVCEIL